jgi:hypothetical protein
VMTQQKYQKCNGEGRDESRNPKASLPFGEGVIFANELLHLVHVEQDN